MTSKASLTSKHVDKSPPISHSEPKPCALIHQWYHPTAAVPGSYSPLVWVLSDVQGVRQHVFLELGCRVVSIWFGLHSKGQLHSMMNSLESQRPSLLWVRLHGPCTGSGNRHDASRAENLSQLIHRQNSLGGRVVLEANVRSNAWNMQALKSIIDQYTCSLHRACRYRLQPPCSAVVQVVSNFSLQSRADCVCPSSRDHVFWKTMPGDVQLELMNTIVRAIASESLKPSTVPSSLNLGGSGDRQPESKNSSQGILPIHESEENPLLRTSSLHSVTQIAENASQIPPSSSKDSRDRSDQVKTRAEMFRSVPLFRCSEYQPRDNSIKAISQLSSTNSIPTSFQVGHNDLLAESNFGFQSCGSKNVQKTVSFPTEEAEKAKLRKKAGHVPVKRAKEIEIHHDDCGEDLSSLEPFLFKMDHLEKLDSELELLQESYENEIFGFITCASFSDEPNKQASKFLDMHSFLTTVSAWPDYDCVDVVEMFGGNGTTSRILAKRYCLRTGQNFEATAGFDLTRQADVQSFWRYMQNTNPYVVIMAPPCGGFGPWARLNRLIYPEAYHRTHEIGMQLARLCAQVATFQVKHGRHYVVEQPQGSAMFQMTEWIQILKHSHQCCFDQCQVGLHESKKPFLPLLKPTDMRSSHPSMLRHLHGRRCHGQHAVHGKVTMTSQVWPRKLGALLARGVAEALHEDSSEYFPTYSCPGCKGHVRSSDPRHTRDENCKHPNVETIIWDCAGCKAHRHRSHESHTFGPDCQWAIVSSRSSGARRPRQGHHPRDPVIKASSEPTGSLRLDPPSVAVTARPEDVSAEPIPDNKRPISDSPIEPERLTVEEADQRRKDKGERPLSTKKVSISTQAGGGVIVPASASAVEEAEIVEPSWSKHDLGAVLQQLNSIRPGIVRRALRRLHLRWFHCGANRMKMLLTAAGVKQEILALVDEIVETCSICRMWVRPGPRSIASTSVCTRFNESVQYDLVFYKTYIILHMIDCCIRWSAACLVEDKLGETLLNAMDKLWFRVYGSPQELVGDRESGVAAGITGARFLEVRGIKLNLKARGQHAFLIERHNEILRQQLHRCDEQSTADGLRVGMENILSESLFAKNCLLVQGGYSPYEALFGRCPPLLNVRDLERDDPQEEEDSFRLRMIAVQSMIEATARAKAQRAERSNTRVSGELLDLKVGDLVEFYRPPNNKDISGWMGPAIVADVTPLSQGIIAVRWQGRTLDCRVQEVRRALVYMSFLAVESSENPVTIMRLSVESCYGNCVRVGWFQQHGAWQACESNKMYPKVLLAGLYVAGVCLNLQGTVFFRFGRNIRTVSAVQCDDSFVLWWKAGDLSCWHHVFTRATTHINLSRLAEMPEQDLCFVQYFLLDSEAVSQLRVVVSDVPNLGGTYEPTMPPLRDASDRLQINRQARKVKCIEDQVTEGPNSDTNPSSSNIHDSHEHFEADDDNAAVLAYNSSDSIHSIVGQGSLDHEISSQPPLQTMARSYFYPEILVVPNDETDEPAELVFTHHTSQYLDKSPKLADDHEISFQYNNDEPPVAVIQRVNNLITRDEALKHSHECKTAMIKELERWCKHKAWVRKSRKDCHNVLQSRWVLKWKNMKDGRGVKARLVVQGFMDRQHVDNYAATTSRWGQRLMINHNPFCSIWMAFNQP